VDPLKVEQDRLEHRRRGRQGTATGSKKERLPVLLLAIALSQLFILFLRPASAQQARPTESQVKAAYLYNFGKFVRWGGPGGERFEICLIGKDPFGEVLDATVADESIDKKKVTVRRISNIQEVAHCRILFVSTSEERRLVAILSAAQRLEVLTVSDITRFAERGGTIGFVNQEERVRFEVNRAAAERSHLSLSSELLKVATRVIDKAPQGS
jgi:YfiR/HmsC-like